MAHPTPTQHAARFVPLGGALNLRDLGGLPLTAGGSTRPGRLLRSDAVRTLAPGDAETIERWALGTVVDLRQTHELTEAPSALAGYGGLAVHHVEVWTHVDAAAGPPADPWSITGFYLGALDHAGPAFARAVGILADAEGAALFHCTAGKDRTGLLALLVLEAVGVTRDAVVEDFALTDARIGPIRERLLADAERRGIARSDFVRLLGATPDLIEPALAHLDRRYGGAEAYLRRFGASEATLGRLHTKLTR